MKKRQHPLRPMYDKIDNNTSKAYAKGRDFEYRVMAYLRKRGWHCMRRFGSFGVVFCSKCGNHVSRRTYKCSRCKTKKNVLKVSLDLTAYKKGIYLMITCKSSMTKGIGTNYLADPYWENMVVYSSRFDAIPVFAGMTTKGKVYLVDLRKRSEIFLHRSQHRTWKSPDEIQIKRLLNEAWSTVDRCNMMLGEVTIKCPQCKKDIIIPDCSEEKGKARYLEIKVKAINNINKLLWRSGAEATQDDLTSIFKKAEKIAQEELDKTENGDKTKK